MSDFGLERNVRPGDLPSGRKGRHLGRVPMILAILMGLLLLFGVIYGGWHRLQQARNAGIQDEKLSTPISSNELDDWLNQQPDGFIDARDQVNLSVDVPPVQKKTAPAPKTIPTKQTQKELSDLEKAYLALQQSLVNNYVIALGTETPAAFGKVQQLEQQTSKLDAASDVASNNRQISRSDGISDAREEYYKRQLSGEGLNRGSTRVDQNFQDSKLDFVNDTPQAARYVASTRTDVISPYEIKTGTVIPGVMISGLNTDLPGQIIAQVSQNVYDTPTGQFLLIPQGTRLYGVYDSKVSYGQNRALVVWTRMIYPDGSTQELEAMQGSDQGGYSGFNDKVNNHYLRTFGQLLLLSVFNAIPSLIEDNDSSTNNSSSSNQTIEIVTVEEEVIVGTDANGDPIVQTITREEPITVTNTNSNSSSSSNTGTRFSDDFQESLAQSLAEVGLEITRKNLNIQPTILIRQGYRFNIMVNKDVAFKSPYKAYR